MTSEKNTESAEENSFHYVRIFVLIFNFISFILYMCLATAADLGGFLGLLQNPQLELFFMYKTQMSPLLLMFYIIWPLYAWQSLIVLYSVVNIFRKSKSGYLYYSPDIFTLPCTLSWSLLWIFNIGYLFLQSAAVGHPEIIPGSVAVICGLIGSSFTVYCLHSISIKDNVHELEKCDNVFCRVINQNGMAALLSWFALIGSMESAMSFKFMQQFTDEESSVVGLTFISVAIAFYNVTDFLVLDHYTRYVISPHLIIIWFLLGICLANNAFMGMVTTVGMFSLVLLCLEFVLLVIKLIKMLVKHHKTTADREDYETLKT